MKNLKMIVSVLGCTFAAAACDINADACNFVGSSAEEPRCQEREILKGQPSVDFKNECENAGGNYGGGCPAGKIVGCQISDDGVERITDWYYPPKTREEAVAACQASSGTIVED